MLTRRNILSGAAAASLLPIPSVAAEKAAERVQRLCGELSQALDEWTGGEFMAEVYATRAVTEGLRCFQFEPARYSLDPDARIGRSWRNLCQGLADRDGLFGDDIFAVIERERFGPEKKTWLVPVTSKD